MAYSSLASCTVSPCMRPPRFRDFGYPAERIDFCVPGARACGFLFDLLGTFRWARIGTASSFVVKSPYSYVGLWDDGGTRRRVRGDVRKG